MAEEWVKPKSEVIVRETPVHVLGDIVKHGDPVRAAYENGIARKTTSRHADRNARWRASTVLKDKSLQEYFWEQCDEANLYLHDVLEEQRRIIFESRLKVFDHRSGEVVDLGPDNHERNIAIQNYLRALGLMSNGNTNTINKVKNKVVINWGGKPIEDTDGPIDVTPKEVIDSIDQLLDSDWANEDDD